MLTCSPYNELLDPQERVFLLFKHSRTYKIIFYGNL